MAETSLTIRIDDDVKDRFQRYAKKQGGMTAVLLQLIASFNDREEEKEFRRREFYQESQEKIFTT